MTIWTSFKSKS